MDAKKTFNLHIVTPAGSAYENDVYQITVQTTSGEITVLPEHIPLISIIEAGEMRIFDNSGTHPFALAGGVIEVRRGNHVVILADHVERATDIDVEEAEKARMRAEELLAQADNLDDVEYAQLNAVLNKELNRLRVGMKYRSLR